jgi:hypothetical protein
MAAADLFCLAKFDASAQAPRILRASEAYSSILSTLANSISTGVDRPKIETITFSV